MHPIPAHAILGMLGSGKTTTLLSLLASSPPGETWAVLVNDFGPVPIDGALIGGAAGRGGGCLVVREVPGGCICCSSADAMDEALDDIAENVRPHRLFIEPTGLADPASFAPSLRYPRSDSPRFRLDSIIGVIDVRLFRRPGLLDMPFWQSLAGHCDDILGSKADLASDAEVLRFLEAMARLSPKKRGVFLDRDSLRASPWMQPSGSPPPKPAPPNPSGHSHGSHPDPPAAAGPGMRHLTHSNNHISVGWTFPDHIQFDPGALSRILGAFHRSSNHSCRIKGLFLTPQGSVAIQTSPDDPSPHVSHAPPQPRSRLSLFCRQSSHWQSLEASILESIGHTNTRPPADAPVR
jgi:G3E family GTPase